MRSRPGDAVLTAAGSARVHLPLPRPLEAAARLATSLLLMCPISIFLTARSAAGG
jgi:hypothetical protein